MVLILKMKHQQVTVDVLKMIFSSGSYLMLAFVAWIFCKLFYACFWLPGHLKRQNADETKKVEVEKRVVENEENHKLENSNDDVLLLSDAKKIN